MQMWSRFYLVPLLRSSSHIQDNQVNRRLKVSNRSATPHRTRKSYPIISFSPQPLSAQPKSESTKTMKSTQSLMYSPFKHSWTLRSQLKKLIRSEWPSYIINTAVKICWTPNSMSNKVSQDSTTSTMASCAKIASIKYQAENQGFKTICRLIIKNWIR